MEAGLPSGTFSTADEALEANREVLVVPGSIDSKQSRGANRLICQGATPIVDDETFDDQLFSLFGLFKQEDARKRKENGLSTFDRRLMDAIAASPLSMEELHGLAAQASAGPWSPARTNAWVARMMSEERVVRYPGGRCGAVVEGSRLVS